MLEAISATHRSILDAVQAPVFRLDHLTRHTFANAAAARAIGRDLEQILGRTLGEAGIPAHLATEIEAHVRRVLATGEPAEYEVTAPTPAGEVVFLTRLEPERDEYGKVVAVVGLGTDITAKSRNMLALQESEESHRLLVEGVADYAIFMIDPTGLVVTWNQGAERIKGYTAAQILGRHFSAFYAEEDVLAGKPEHLLVQALANGRVEDEGWRRRRDGSRFWASVVLTTVKDAAGLLRGICKVTRDLSQQRAAEEALRQSEQRYRTVVEDQTESSAGSRPTARSCSSTMCTAARSATRPRG